MSEEYSEQEYEEALKWANNFSTRLHGSDNPYHGIPHWEQVWELLHQMELVHVMSSAVDRVYVLGEIYLGTVDQVAKMSKEDVRRIIDTSKYQEQPLDRDTRFMGFAEPLFDELVANARTFHSDYPYPVFSPQDVERFEESQQKIIAHWAYRFACHIVNHTSESNLKRVHAGLWSAEQCVDQIPDMPEVEES